MYRFSFDRIIRFANLVSCLLGTKALGSAGGAGCGSLCMGK